MWILPVSAEENVSKTTKKSEKNLSTYFTKISVLYFIIGGIYISYVFLGFIAQIA